MKRLVVVLVAVAAMALLAVGPVQAGGGVKASGQACGGYGP